MRTTAFLGFVCLVFLGCSKDKFNTIPHIEFKSISPNPFVFSLNPSSGTFLTLQLTDAEGDFGFKGNDSSYVYIKNLTVPPFKSDSLKFPDLSLVKPGKLDVELIVNLDRALEQSSTLPHTDTLFFEVYVKDFAKNKSNVLVTPEPLYYITP